MAFYHNGSAYSRYTGGGVGDQPTEYTLACWVKLPASNNSSFCVRSGGIPTLGWSHQLKANSGQFNHYTYDGNTRNVLSSTVFILNKWYHIAGTAKNGVAVRLYINGKEEGTPTALGTVWQGGNDFWTGVATGGGGNALVG